MPAPLQLFNTPHDLRTFYETSVIKDTPDPNETYVLFNQTKDLIEDMYSIKINESLDQSQIFSVGDTFLTMHPLPLDWRSTNKITLTPQSGASVPQLPCYEVPFRRREAFQLQMHRYYIDAKNKQFAMCGKASQNMIINHWYQCYNNQMSVDTEDDTGVINWPNRFWPILVYGAASIRNGAFDADAMAFRMSIEQSEVFDNLLQGLINWDQDLKLQDMNGRGGYADDVSDDGEEYNAPYNNYIGLL